MATAKFPGGRLIRVILVCVVCDKPAAHKLGGFGSHAHRFFCTRCWVDQKSKATAKCFEANGQSTCHSLSSIKLIGRLLVGFPERSNAQHRAYQVQYQQCKTKSAQDDFVKTCATRWCQLARLPYFDLCRMIVVDPMHNLFLGASFFAPWGIRFHLGRAGLVKTHFYHIWIQQKVMRKGKELCRLHAILSEVNSLISTKSVC
jgi:hypothetical protein